MKSTIAFLSFLFLLFLWVDPVGASTKISLDSATNTLVVSNAAGEKLGDYSNGTISEKINADGQIFKLSYGEDLNGRNIIIIYPDPDAPQSLQLNLLDQEVSMTPDSVLTVTSTGGGQAAQFQAGVLGQVTLAGSSISPGSSLSVQNGQMLTATPPELTEERETAVASQGTSEVPAAPRSVDAEAERLISEFNRGLVVKEVTGTVMMAEAGADVMDLLRNSTSLPTLKPGDVVPIGASIRTDFGGSVIVAQSPGATFQVLENTNLKVESSSYQVENGVEKREFKGNMSRGGVISSLDRVDPNNTVYEIQTPLCVAAARGTAFSVFTSDSISVIITAKGNVEVITKGGTFKTSEGTKTVVTLDDRTGEERAAQFDATSSEVQIIKNLIQAAQALNASLNGGGGGSPPDDLQDQLNDAAKKFLETFTPTLNPGAITPIQSGQ